MIKGFLVAYYFSVLLYYSGIEVFNKRIKFDFKFFIAQLIYIIVYGFNFENGENIKFLIDIVIIFIYYKIIFKEDMFKIVQFTMIIYSVRFLVEAVINILDIMSYNIISLNDFFAENYYMYCYLTGTLTAIIIIICKKRLSKFLNSIKFYSIKYMIFFSIIMIVLYLTMMMRSNLSVYIMEEKFSIHIILIICLFVVVTQMLKDNKYYEKISKQYLDLTNYFKYSEELIEEYKYLLHENKNQLLVIKGMSDNEELNKYLDTLIGKRRNLKYEWICDLKNIPIQGLKGLVNYKVSEMYNYGLNVELYIDKSVGKSNRIILNQEEQEQLYSIIGIFLDNALEASKLSDEKMVSINSYREKNVVYVTIANTFKGDIDLDKINEFGFSTKGRNRGVGLPLVKKIVEKSNVYYNKTEIIDNFFIQNLEIRLSK